MAGREVEIATDAIEVDVMPQLSQRTRTLSQKARQNQDQLENTNTTAVKASKRAARSTNGQTEGSSADSPAGDASGWQKVLEVVGISHKEIRKLTQIMSLQQETIKNLEKCL
ncbi:hypothetical protein F5884DRAFT_758441 [Xylogone sp. PMI_703]|nr:hypothetical protein F5884DRAFT_758441 [Xylogone sp. PMI_703]